MFAFYPIFTRILSTVAFYPIIYTHFEHQKQNSNPTEENKTGNHSTEKWKTEQNRNSNPTEETSTASQQKKTSTASQQKKTKQEHNGRKSQQVTTTAYTT